jgi:hypothetical protein
MQYDPSSTEHRKTLAEGILSTMQAAGLQIDELRNSQEITLSVLVKEGIKVRVYTSVDKRDGLIRACGEDAIRVCTLYRTREGDVRGIGKETRVHRTGDINMIVVRLVERIAKAKEALKEMPICHCGAPQFKSKKGNMVCADLCWK